MKDRRGFTLIELLVVIAIIGILSAVVLAALITSRGKGSNAAVQSDLATIQTQAEIYYGDNSASYNTGATISNATCSSLTQSGSILASPSIQSALKGAKNAVGADSDCGITSTAYSIAAPLVSTAGDSAAWCIDSVGGARGSTIGGVKYTAVSGSATAAHTNSGSTVCN